MRDEIRTFIVQQFARARSRNLGDEDQLLESGVIDSLGVLDVVAFLEQRFGIEILEDDLVMQNFQTIGRIAALVEAKRRP